MRNSSKLHDTTQSAISGRGDWSRLHNSTQSAVYETRDWPALHNSTQRTYPSGNSSNFISNKAKNTTTTVYTDLQISSESPTVLHGWLSGELAPPNTPGAFLHLGKTGGSTLCSQLRNGCHSWAKKPCHIPTNESLVSHLTTYYHVPDFEKILHQHSYDFYVWTARDPFSRTASAYTYVHPANLRKERRKYWKQVRNAVARAYSCFPTFEEFATAIGDDPEHFDYPYSPTGPVNITNCTNLARAVMHSKVKNLEHQYFNTKKIIESLSSPSELRNKTVLVVRNEYMWQDWTTLNEWLGQESHIATFPQVHLRDYASSNLPVGRNITTLGRERICRALRPEYEAYLRIISLAANLGENEKEDTLAIARGNCPSLNLSFTSTLGEG